MTTFHLWNLIISIVIVILVASVVTAAIFANKHNKNPRVVSCPPCFADCTDERTPAGQERCPTDPENCTEGQCIFNYMNFSTACFIISPITTLNSGNALFSEVKTLDQGTMVLSPYGETDNTGLGITFTYTTDGYLLNNKQNAGNDQRITIDPLVVIPPDDIFTVQSFRVHHTIASVASDEVATFELINGRIVGTLGGNKYYLAWRRYVDVADSNTAKIIIVAVNSPFPQNTTLWMNTLFRPIGITCPP